MRLTPAQLERLADRFLAAHGCADLAVLTHDSLEEFDARARALRRRQRGSAVVGAGRPGSRREARPLTANLPQLPQRAALDDEERECDFLEETEGADDIEQAADGRHGLLDDFAALLDTHRLAARDGCTPRMAQLAAARQREALVRMGDLLGFDDFQSLHRALYSFSPARRDRAPNGRRGGQAATGQVDLFGGAP